METYGPCEVCGDTDYPLSTSGPDICPACDVMGADGRARELFAQNRELRLEHAAMRALLVETLEIRAMWELDWFSLETGSQEDDLMDRIRALLGTAGAQ